MIKEIEITREDIEAAIAAIKGTASPSSVCPMVQAARRNGIQAEEVQSDTIDVNDRIIRFQPPLPDELYLESEWETALNGAPYRFRLYEVQEDDL